MGKGGGEGRGEGGAAIPCRAASADLVIGRSHDLPEVNLNLMRDANEPPQSMKCEFFGSFPCFIKELIRNDWIVKIEMN